MKESQRNSAKNNCRKIYIGVKEINKKRMKKFLVNLDRLPISSC
jgi:hypothetical protein